MPNIENNTEGLQEILESLKNKVAGGAEAERSKFWDTFQNYGNRMAYGYAFAFDGWTDETFNPKYPIGTNTDCNLNGCFYNTYRITRIPQIIRIHSWTNVSDAFKACSALVEVRFEGAIGKNISFADSPLLSKASVENVISVLHNDLGSTVTFNSAVRDKFTDAEWNALIATKPNWTISLA